LYYFGAIRDDNNSDLAAFSLKQVLVDSPAKAGTRVLVNAVAPREQLTTRLNGGLRPPRSATVRRR
jgi:hypothetical protein